jgi:exopolyphosphatase / guanosine-5'-triphosphate,3'-diphosphate pyrophosphatase
MKIATIDIGSNSILLLIAQVNNGDLSIITREQNVTALGKNLDQDKVFCQSSMGDSFRALVSYANTIKEHGLKLDETIVTATEASRVATNSKEFFKKIKSTIGFSITTITGEAEAYFSALGACIDVNNEESVTIMDIGGASTELVRVKLNPFEVEDFVSLPIGSVRVTNWLNENKLDENLEIIKNTYLDKINSFRTHKLLCVAGTMTSIANMHQNLEQFVEEKVHNYNFSKDQLDEIVNNLKNYNADEFSEQYPFLGKRSNAIGGGLRASKFMTDLLKTQQLVVSTYGLMFGVALSQGVKDGYIFRE